MSETIITSSNRFTIDKTSEKIFYEPSTLIVRASTIEYKITTTGNLLILIYLIIKFIPMYYNSIVNEERSISTSSLNDMTTSIETINDGIVKVCRSSATNRTNYCALNQITTFTENKFSLFISLMYNSQVN